MTPDRWRQIDDLLQMAIERHPADRRALLDEACADDEELRREVESLILYHEQAESFIESPAFEDAAELLVAGEAQSLEGRVIGPYKVIHQIGRGGMGDVYLAQDRRLGRRVALKLLPVTFTRDGDRLRRFQQEARAASSLNHPNIITIYEVGEADESHYIATEYIEGQTLRGRIKSGAMRLGEVMEVGIQVASALGAAHEAGIVHRDIKPENVMVRPDGLVKVLDFGLAKLAERQALAVDTETPTIPKVDTDPGRVMGTASYMSPEQARGLAVDERTDIFSLGVVMYEMVAGRAPFEGKTTSDVIAAILGKDAAPLARYSPEAPVEMQWIITKALRKEREERYQTAKEMLSDLREVKQELELKSKQERSEMPERERAETVLQLARASDEQANVDTADKAAARTDEAAVRATSSAEVILSEFKRHKAGVTVFVSILILIVAGIGYGLYKSATRRQDKSAAPFQEMKITRLTESGRIVDAAISPDGKYVVYVEQDAKRQNLKIKQLATGVVLQVAPPDNVEYYGLTFSNDSNYLYYVRYDGGNSLWVLYQVPALGGISKKLITHIDSAITFSPDGKRFAFIRAHTDGHTTLMTANADGTEEQVLATRTSPKFFACDGIVRISWSPDGKMIACPAKSRDADGPYDNVVGVRVEDGAEVTLTSPRRADYIRQVMWLADGSGIATIAREKEGFQILHLSYPEGKARRITNDLNHYTDVSLTADSSVLVTVQEDIFSNIWAASDGDGRLAQQITSGRSEGLGGLSWTPDGKIVYGERDIWTMDADGSNSRRLTREGGYTFPSVSPDGRYIVFCSVRANSFSIWRMDRDGSNLKQLTNGPNHINPRVSPDGQWVIYSSGFPEYALWKVPINGGSSSQLSGMQSGMLSGLLAISPDGKLIACTYWDHQATPPYGIAIIPFEGGQPLMRFGAFLSQDSVSLHWTLDGRALLYIDNRGANIWSQPIDGGPPKQVTHFQGIQLFNFAWSHDGKKLALARGTKSSDVVLISNFR